MDIQDPVEIARSIIKAFDEAPEDGYFDEGHPIFCMAQEIDRLRAELKERQRHTLNKAMADDVLSFCASRNLYRDTLNGAVGAAINHALTQEREIEQERDVCFRLGIRLRMFCLGCGKRHEEDCGCPAGTSERLVNIRAELAEARVRELGNQLVLAEDSIIKQDFNDALARIGIARRELKGTQGGALANSEKED